MQLPKASHQSVSGSDEWVSASGQNGINHVRFFHAGRAGVEPVVRKGEAIVINPELMQNRGVQVAYVDRVANDVVAEFICLAVDRPAPHTTSCHPHREAPRMVVAAVIGTRQLALTEDGPAKLTAPDHERLV